MIKNVTNIDVSDFCTIMENNGFSPDQFLFRSTPYMGGTINIVNTTQNAVDNPKSHILDIGCGTGLTSFLLSKNANKVVGIDIFEKSSTQFYRENQLAQQNLWKNLTKLTPNLNFEFYDGSKLPFNQKQFNLVFLHAVFEHVSADKIHLLLNEIYRVLKSGSYLVIARTPDKYSITEFITKAHDRKFTKQELMAYINQNVYTVKHYEKTDFFPENAYTKSTQAILNSIYPFTAVIDHLINKTPLKTFSHHHFFILRK